MWCGAHQAGAVKNRTVWTGVYSWLFICGCCIRHSPPLRALVENFPLDLNGVSICGTSPSFILGWMQ